MKPFRKNVAIAIDGGGIRGLIVARALSILEDHLGQPVCKIFQLTAGTSTGAILAAGIAAGSSAGRMFQLYRDLGKVVFQKSWRTLIWPFSRYRYPLKPLELALKQEFGDLRLGKFWEQVPPTDVVITTFDLLENRTRFIKPWKKEYQDWPVVKAVLSSCAVPTYFQIVENRYVDGGVGAYANPCYLAAYELSFCLGWNPSETTLISLGTGRSPYSYNPRRAGHLWTWEWIAPMVGAFLQSADDQQMHLVDTFFEQLDFRRFQVILNRPYAMDDPSNMTRLTIFGDELGRMILNDITAETEN